MTTRTPGPDGGSHATHDRLLIAARAAGDLGGRDLARADAILSACEPCRDLLAELRLIATASRLLPPPARPADLDFRLTGERAAGLTRGSVRRRLLRPFGRAGYPIVRPLAMALTTLGLAGLVVAALPLLPSAGGAAVLSATGGAVQTPSIQARTLDRGAPPPTSAPVPVQAGDEETSSLGPASPEPEATGDDRFSASGLNRNQAFGEPAGPGGPPPLVLFSGASLGLGIGLALLRWAALRLR